MSTQTMKQTFARARAVRRDCSDEECPAGSRNNYFLGKRLTPAGYQLEQSYSIKRRRLTNRAIHGWGVVYGFALTMSERGKQSRLEPGDIGIGEGFALDQLGRELIQTRETAVSLDNVLILDDDRKPVRVDGKNLDDRLEGLTCAEDDCWLLSAHYAEQTIEEVPIKDPCSCDHTEWDRTCETVVYSLRRIDCDDCCDPWQCELDCDCPPDTDCCTKKQRELDKIASIRQRLIDEYERELETCNPKKRAPLRSKHEQDLHSLALKQNEVERKLHPRGGCSCLCEHLTRLEVGADCERLVDVDNCTHADLVNGVALACIRLARDDCGDWTIGSIVDACGPRRLVKRNDLLFDLINGCDVTRISETGWAKWHRRSAPPVPFEEFTAALGWAGDVTDEPYPTRDFWVRFSRPVRTDTLVPDAFVMAVMTDVSDDGWRRYLRVPIVAIDTEQGQPGTPDGYAIGAKIVLGSHWMSDANNDTDHIFRKGPTRVEIEVRGDLIVDCLGQQVDANSRGRSAFPTGNGSPGGTYVSAFTVAQWTPEEKPKPSPEPAQSAKQQAAQPKEQPQYRNF